MANPSGALSLDGQPVARTATLDRVEIRKRLTVWQRLKQNKLAVGGIVVLVLFYAMALLQPVIATHPYDEITSGMRNTAPSDENWMGTDRSGRDVYSRLIKGGQISLAAGFMAVAIVMTIGISLGAMAGFFGGWVDQFVMRLTDVLLAIPLILLLITAASLFRPSLQTTIIVIGVSSWPGTARLVRGQFLALKNQEFVTAARAMGANPVRIMA
ncbi:MAG: ABC transporter permease, partial [Chloroflexia bacterium]|nr:ABC transporter permease [Chloroflexia bacterium]